MKLKKTLLSAAVLMALGTGGMAVTTVASAAVLPDGTYKATINVTPTSTYRGNTFYLTGSDGAWNSSFTFSALPATGTSQGMTDNSTDLTACGASGTSTCGSSQLGNGAGSWTMKVTGGTFTTSNFQADAIFTTAGGTFVEYGSMTGGTINQTTGAVTLDPTGRLGSVGNFQTALYNEPWNIPDAGGVKGALGTTYAPLITGTSANANGSVTGRGITSNGDGTYNMILASASAVGVSWGGFDTNPYVETWNVTLTPLLIAKADSASAQPGVAQLIDVKKNDTIGSGVTPTIVLPSPTSTNGATLTVSSGKVSYTASSAGTDTFQYELKDSKGDTTPSATVTVTVAPGVTATNDTASTPEGKFKIVDVLANDSGATGATVTISTQPAHGKATVNSSNQVVYTPKPGFVGTDTFQYTDTASGKTSTATVTVTVKAAFQAKTPGVSVSPGAIAKKAGSSGLMSTQQLTAAGIPADSGVSQQCIGGCFDFEVTGVGSGGQAMVAMLPLSKPIPSGARFRKYINGKWQDFVTSNGDSVASAPGSATSCPLPSLGNYKTGLTAGDYCVRLAITDGGPNDNDGTAGVIADPSGIATGAGTSGAPTAATDFKGLGSGGCALGTDASPWHGGSWWLIGAVIGWLGFSRRRRSPQRS